MLDCFHFHIGFLFVIEEVPSILEGIIIKQRQKYSLSYKASTDKSKEALGS